MTTARLDDLALADALLLLWKRRFHLIVAVVGASLIALAITLNLPKTYRATATFVISDAKMPARGEAPADIRYMDTYAALLRSPAVTARVVKNLDLQRRFHFSPIALASAFGVRAVPNTLLITLSLDLTDPALAAEIVNGQAAQTVELSRTMLTSDLAGTQGYLKEQVQASQADLKIKEAELQKVRGEARVDSNTERLKRLVEVRGTIEEQYSKAAQDAAGTAQGVKSIREALAGQSRILTLTRQVVDNPTLKEAVAAEKPRTPTELLGLRMQQQVVNPLYEQSEPYLVQASAEAASAAVRRDTAAAQLKSNLLDLQAIERDLAVGSTRLEAAKREYELAKAAYENFTKSYEQARLSVRAQVPELKLVDPATPNPYPIGPNVVLNVAIAIVASFILAVFALLLGDYLRLARQSVPVAEAAAEPDVELARTRTLHAPGTR